ncbi:hypothetical protein NXV95_06920 [Bacteroides fragilis]|nr:hypothetical protein [Bacteroides fragilis]
MEKQEGDNAKLPKFKYGNARELSSRWLMPTDYLRLKTCHWGFLCPQRLIVLRWVSPKQGFTVSANNLLTWKSKDLLVDPEMPVDGLCTFEMPALRTYTFGLEIGF